MQKNRNHETDQLERLQDRQQSRLARRGRGADEADAKAAEFKALAAELMAIRR
jgi:hypothetical protein